MAGAQGAPSILRDNLSQGVSVVLDGRVSREQNGGDFVPIHDIDLQGSPGIGGQGSLTPIFRIPQDFEYSLFTHLQSSIGNFLLLEN
ncbi:MAG: hypothetical protein Q6M04_06740 [Thermostichus sp. BF3_bins_97]